MAKRFNENWVAGQPMQRVLQFLWMQAWAIERRGEELEDRSLEHDDFKNHFATNVGALIHELVARGWFEKVQKNRTGRGSKDRYHLTEEGQRIAHAATRVLMWPAASSKIRPPPSYSGWLDCLIHLHSEMTRLGMTESNLAPYQVTILQDLPRRPRRRSLGPDA